jgi:hypothetical protein
MHDGRLRSRDEAYLQAQLDQISAKIRADRQD